MASAIGPPSPSPSPPPSPPPGGDSSAAGGVSPAASAPLPPRLSKLKPFAVEMTWMTGFSSRTPLTSISPKSAGQIRTPTYAESRATKGSFPKSGSSPTRSPSTRTARPREKATVASW